MTPPKLNQQIEQWLHVQATAFAPAHRPFITLSYAQSWDGSITTHCGESLTFSGDQAMRLTHQLRSLHDGILVGIGTVLSDDPQLTVREWEGANPQPIILDSQLRTPPTAKLCTHPDRQCWILTVSRESKSFGDNVEILAIQGNDDAEQQVPLTEAMALLRRRGIKRLMVEGGGRVITAFLKAQLADALVLTVAPRLVGGYRAVGDLQSEGGEAQFRIDPLYSAPAGQDLIVWGDLHYGGSGT